MLMPKMRAHNGSNLWVRIYYPDVQLPKYRRMAGGSKSRRNLEHGEINDFGRKMRITKLIVKCNRC